MNRKLDITAKKAAAEECGLVRVEIRRLEAALVIIWLHKNSNGYVQMFYSLTRK
jgi:hypothetical protein